MPPACSTALPVVLPVVDGLACCVVASTDLVGALSHETPSGGHDPALERYAQAHRKVGVERRHAGDSSEVWAEQAGVTCLAGSMKCWARVDRTLAKDALLECGGWKLLCSKEGGANFNRGISDLILLMGGLVMPCWRVAEVSARECLPQAAWAPPRYKTARLKRSWPPPAATEGSACDGQRLRQGQRSDGID